MSAYTLTKSGDLGGVLREVRKTWGYSQRELAKIADVSQKFVSELECGKETVQLKQVLNVCRALDLDVSIDMSRLLAKVSGRD